MTVSGPISENDFFANNPAPGNLDEISRKLMEFLNYHKEQGNLHRKKIVLVTSGGTTVPLENNTVRFIDNFSAGTRGSLSAEHFLNNGYLVIFLHREFSLLPFLNHFGHLNFLDLLTLNDSSIDVDHDKITCLDRDKSLGKILENYKYHQSRNHCLMIPFTTINEYLFTLKSISEDLKNYYKENNAKILIYLAAAVSDFFIPHTELPEHKIQSSIVNNPATDRTDGKQIEISSSTNGKLRLNLDPVPKFLKSIVNSWYNDSFVVSFKLETDSNLLLKKCKQALEKYDHQLVIGNLLQTRKKEVVFASNMENGQFQHVWYKLAEEAGVIESVFIPRVIDLHDNWISRSSHEKPAK